jgi:hypothetical protein
MLDYKYSPFKLLSLKGSFISLVSPLTDLAREYRFNGDDDVLERLL